MSAAVAIISTVLLTLGILATLAAIGSKDCDRIPTYAGMSFVFFVLLTILTLVNG